MTRFLIKEFFYKDGSPLIRVGNRSFAEELVPYLPFIQKITGGERVLYHTFRFFLLYGDGNNLTGIAPWSFWYLLRTNLQQEARPGDLVCLTYYRNLDTIARMLKKEFGVRIKKERRHPLALLAWKCGSHISTLLFFKMRTLLKKRHNPKRVDALCVTSYERYFRNQGFFPDKLFTDKRFQKAVGRVKKHETVYVKYDARNLREYLHAERANALFLEDFLTIPWRMLFKTLLPSKRKILKTKRIEEEYIRVAYRLFKRDIAPFITAYYESVCCLLEQARPRSIILDSEKSLAFTLFALAREELKNPPRLVVCSHELITTEYDVLSYPHTLKPDLKLVWNEQIKAFLHKERKWPKQKLVVFPDPRIYKWRKMKKRKKSILIVSQGHTDAYEELASNACIQLFKKLSKKYTIYFKPHPAEWIETIAKRRFEKLMQKKFVKKVTKLGFIPAYTIGTNSIMLYEMAVAGSEVFYQDKEGWFRLVAPTEKGENKGKVGSIKEALLRIEEGRRGWKA